MNSKLRQPGVNSVKRGNLFVIRTLDKVDSAGSGRVILLLGTTFLHINVVLKNWPVNMNAAIEVWPVISSFWTDFDHSGLPLF